MVVLINFKIHALKTNHEIFLYLQSPFVPEGLRKYHNYNKMFLFSCIKLITHYEDSCFVIKPMLHKNFLINIYKL